MAVDFRHNKQQHLDALTARPCSGRYTLKESPSIGNMD